MRRVAEALHTKANAKFAHIGAVAVDLLHRSKQDDFRICKPRFLPTADGRSGIDRTGSALGAEPPEAGNDRPHRKRPGFSTTYVCDHRTTTDAPGLQMQSGGIWYQRKVCSAEKTKSEARGHRRATEKEVPRKIKTRPPNLHASK